MPQTKRTHLLLHDLWSVTVYVPLFGIYLLFFIKHSDIIYSIFGHLDLRGRTLKLISYFGFGRDDAASCQNQSQKYKAYENSLYYVSHAHAFSSSITVTRGLQEPKRNIRVCKRSQFQLTGTQIFRTVSLCISHITTYFNLLWPQTRIPLQFFLLVDNPVLQNVAWKGSNSSSQQDLNSKPNQ